MIGVRRANRSTPALQALSPGSEASRRRDALAVFSCLLAVYLLTASGHLYSPDEEAMYYVVRSIATRADVAVEGDDLVPMPLREGRNGRMFSPYGILPSLAALPFFGAGALLATGASIEVYEYLTRFSVSLLNAPVTAATGALLGGFVRSLGYSRRAGWLAALSFGLATLAWPYARTFFSEPLAGLLLLIAVERAYAARARAGRQALLASGLAAGALLATRIAAGVAIPLLGLYVAVTAYPGHPARSPASTGRHPASSSLWRSGESFRSLGMWLLALAPGCALVVGYNLIRFAHPFASGYGSEAQAFTTPLMNGLSGLLLSPGKSLFLYAPATVLALPGVLLLWRSRRAEAVVLALLTAAHVVLYARWHAWDGGGVWGPRLLLPIVPLLLVLAAPLFDRVALRAGRALISAVTGALLVMGVVNALAGVLVNPAVYLNSEIPLRQIYFNPVDSPLLAHWRILADRLQARYGTDQCVLGDGFYFPEARGSLLPRMTGYYGAITCTGTGPLRIRLDMNDDRPADAPPGQPALELAGQRFALRQGIGSRVRVLIPSGTTLTLRAKPFARTISGTERQRFIGVRVTELHAVDARGARLPLSDAAIEPPPASPRYRWGWYFVPTVRHTTDLWPGYLLRSEVGHARSLLVALLIVGSALAASGIGAALLFRQGRETERTNRMVAL